MNSIEFISTLKSSFSKELPGIYAHRNMSPINRLIEPLTDDKRKNYRQSAVAVVCFPIDDIIHFYLIQRPEYEGNHSAQMSFPGGKWEETDEHIEFTARRETFEEIGIELKATELLGQLTEVYIPVSNFIIQPFVYYLDYIPTLIPDEREVDSVLEVAMHQLLDDTNVEAMDMRLITGMNMKNVPYFRLNDKVVWGATAIILSELKQMLKQ